MAFFTLSRRHMWRGVDHELLASAFRSTVQDTVEYIRLEDRFIELDIKELEKMIADETCIRYEIFARKRRQKLRRLYNNS